MTKLAFLISVPRAGSTLIQRYLNLHPEIASASEPWLCLPHVYARQTEGVSACYGTLTANVAVREFVEKLPRGEEDYNAALRNFFMELYAKAANRSTFFLDKTPRYYYIIPQLMEIFPDAKVILLFRNPLSVLSSVIQTWSRGSFQRIPVFHDDLFIGPKLIAQAKTTYPKRIHALNYETFIDQPLETMNEIFAYLGIKGLGKLPEEAPKSVDDGKMGDKTGASEYKAISKSAQDKWMTCLDNKFRAIFAKRYLKSLGKEVLTTSGYDMGKLVEKLRKGKGDNLGALRDGFWYCYGYTQMLTKRYGIKIVNHNDVGK